METLEKEASEACKCRALQHARWKKMSQSPAEFCACPMPIICRARRQDGALRDRPRPLLPLPCHRRDRPVHNDGQRDARDPHLERGCLPAQLGAGGRGRAVLRARAAGVQGDALFDLLPSLADPPCLRRPDGPPMHLHRAEARKVRPPICDSPRTTVATPFESDAHMPWPPSPHLPAPLRLLPSARPPRSIRAGEPPDGSTYQDGYGKTRKWTKEEMEGKSSWSWIDPRTWFGYKPLSEVNVAPTAANAA
jgi:hypothetical protein